MANQTFWVLLSEEYIPFVLKLKGLFMYRFDQFSPFLRADNIVVAFENDCL